RRPFRAPAGAAHRRLAGAGPAAPPGAGMRHVPGRRHPLCPGRRRAGAEPAAPPPDAGGGLPGGRRGGGRDPLTTTRTTIPTPTPTGGMKPMWKTTSLASAIALCLAAPLWAEDLTIAIKAAVDNADPHQLYTPNRNVQLQVYEPLIYQDQYLKPQPWLATSWENVEPTVWLIHLREGVTF